MLDYLLGNNKVNEMMTFNLTANARTLVGDAFLPVLKVPKAILGTGPK